jgi:hypothetical protein
VSEFNSNGAEVELPITGFHFTTKIKPPAVKISIIDDTGQG